MYKMAYFGEVRVGKGFISALTTNHSWLQRNFKQSELNKVKSEVVAMLPVLNNVYVVQCNDTDEIKIINAPCKSAALEKLSHLDNFSFVSEKVELLPDSEICVRTAYELVNKYRLTTRSTAMVTSNLYELNCNDGYQFHLRTALNGAIAHITLFKNGQTVENVTINEPLYQLFKKDVRKIDLI